MLFSNFSVRYAEISYLSMNPSVILADLKALTLFSIRSLVVKERYIALDAMRGVAATLVLLAHLSTIGLRETDIWRELDGTPLRLFWSGHQAVIFFFVLSGFSLFEMYSTMSGKFVLWRFFAARIIRLYPAYISSIFLAMLIIGLLKYLDYSWPPQSVGIPLGGMTKEQFIGHVFIVGFFDPNLVNSPIWSLVHEIRISLLFPLIYLIVRNSKLVWMGVLPISISILMSMIFISKHGIYHIIMNHPALLDFVLTIHYATMFFLGAWQSKYKSRITQEIRHFRLPIFATATVCSLLTYAYGFDEHWTQGYRFLGDLVVAVATMYFIAIGIEFPRIFNNRACHFLGSVSYSLYLVHMPCIIFLVVLYYGLMSSYIIIVLAALTSFILASIFLKLVDTPAIAIARAVRFMGQPRKL